MTQTTDLLASLPQTQPISWLPELQHSGLAAFLVVAIALSIAWIRKRSRALRSQAAEAGLPPCGSGDSDAYPRYEISYRHEYWTTEDGMANAMLLVSCRDICVAHAFSVKPDGGGLYFARGLFDSDAIASDRDDLIASMDLVPATKDALHLFCVFQENVNVFCAKVAEFAAVFAHAASNWQEYAKATRIIERSKRGLYDYHGFDDLFQLCAVPRTAPPLKGSMPRILTMSDPRGLYGQDPINMDTLADFLSEWHAHLVRMTRPCSLTRNGWDPVTFDYLSVPEPTLQRRRQAAELHPVLFPYLPQIPEVMEAIDAGRPFEKMLLAWLKTHVVDIANTNLDMARLKRLRSYPETPIMRTYDAATFRVEPLMEAHRPHPLSSKDIAIDDVIRVATRFPLDVLPRTPEGWRRIVPDVTNAVSQFDRWGIPLSSLLIGMPPEWGLGDLAGIKNMHGPSLPYHVRGEMDGLNDMIRRLDDTVVARSEPAVVEMLTTGPRTLAARMLLDGRTFKAALALQRTWHERIPEQNRLLPAQPGEDEYSWPALFLPLAFDDGIRLHCLTTSSALRNEGTRGKDETGMLGLSHCVGGYGRHCATGENHIVSLTGPGEGGIGRQRLSTLQLKVTPDSSVQIVQHKSMHNGRPSQESLAAASRLVRMIETRQITLNPKALELREPIPLRVEGYDLAAAARAWEPYLTPYGRDACARLVSAG